MRLDRLLQWLTGVELVVACLWIGLAAITVALLILMHTRWGQAHPLRKCLILSLLAHALLASYATTVKIVFAPPTVGRETTVQLTLLDGDSDAAHAQPVLESHEEAEPKPWETFNEAASAAAEPTELPRAETSAMTEVRRQVDVDPVAMPALEPVHQLALGETARPQPEDLPAPASEPKVSAAPAPQPIEVPSAERREAPRMELPAPPAAQRPAEGQVTTEPPTRTTQPGLPSALLQARLSAPRLDDSPQPAEAEAALDSPDAEPMQPAHGAPAALVGLGLGDAASQSSAGTEAEAKVGSLPPPSLAAGRADPVHDSIASARLPLVAPPPNNRGSAGIPEIYQLRVAPDRFQRTEKLGATGETEEAVGAALKWLADHQALSGAWIAIDYDAGQERMVYGRDRQGAGAGADAGVTGLALLAFLAAGNTHRQGKYQAPVSRGIDYLLAVQSGDGNLAGAATEYAAMYCHAMATLALSEAYAMSGDARLREPIRLAVSYTAAMQNPVTGGWRYRRGDDGDTSQLGWQLMALKSAELAGIPVPSYTWQGAARFLQSVSSGQYGGLASYRRGERVSFAMTAEALVCRQFLGLSPHSSTAKEAGDYLLRELPGESNPPNEYYWYYGTLSMYQLQDSHWKRWNEALKRTLLPSQRKDGAMAGSWDTNTLWGGYGGRVYTTAMAALSLEIYYRYLPLYERAPRGE